MVIAVDRGMASQDEEEEGDAVIPYLSAHYQRNYEKPSKMNRGRSRVFSLRHGKPAGDCWWLQRLHKLLILSGLVGLGIRVKHILGFYYCVTMF